MVKSKTKQFPEGSVKDCERYDGPLKEWIEADEGWLRRQSCNFALYGFDHESMFVPAIFPMVGAVQGKYIHGSDFFGDGIFVDFDEPRSPDTSSDGSHHSGWRLLKDEDEPHGIVLLSRSNPNTCGVEVLIEGEPPEEWVGLVLRTYYTARRTAMVAQSRFRREAQRSGCAMA